MHVLRLLGPIGFSDENGREFDSLLRKPKHAALLAYLAMPRPGTWHRRDTIIGILWPDTDQTRARAALRSALLVLRRDLPDGAILTRGDDDLSLSPEVVRTDVATMADALEAKKLDEALAQWRGELLSGFFVREAPDFEAWLDRERMRVRSSAILAATRLSELRETTGDLAGAIAAAQRASDLDPDNETNVRRLITVLDRSGDRAKACAIYDRFRAHLADSLGVEPSAETVAMAESIRSRVDLPRVVDRTSATPVTAPGPVHAGLRLSHARHLRLALLGTIPAVLVLALLAMPSRRVAKDPVRSLVVLPTRDETGDSSLSWIAAGILEGVSRRLDGLGSVRSVSAARAPWTANSSEQQRAVARAYAAAELLHTTLRRSNDSLELTAVVINTETDEEKRIGTYAFSTLSLRNVEVTLAAAVAGSLFRIVMPTFPESPHRNVEERSYALMLQGWHEVFVGERAGAARARYISAKKFFDSALVMDASNARAYAGLSTVWGYQAGTDLVPFNEGYELSVAAAEKALALDSMQGSAWGNLAVMRAYKTGNLRVGLELIAKAEAAEPSNPEIYAIKTAMLKAAHRFDESAFTDRLARQLDPMNPNMRVLVGHSELCAGRGKDAVRLYEPEVELNPADRRTREALTRALAMAGRYDDAIVSWRIGATIAGDTTLLRWLSSARGRDGYWNVRHAEGRRRLENLARQNTRVAPLRVVQAAFAAGDEDAGYRAIDAALAAGTPGLYRLPCMPEIDEFRNTPRFRQVLERVGKLSMR